MMSWVSLHDVVGNRGCVNAFVLVPYRLYDSDHSPLTPCTRRGRIGIKGMFHHMADAMESGGLHTVHMTGRVISFSLSLYL